MISHKMSLTSQEEGQLFMQRYRGVVPSQVFMKSLLRKAVQRACGSRCKPLGTVQFVGSVAAASVENVAVGEYG